MAPALHARGVNEVTGLPPPSKKRQLDPPVSMLSGKVFSQRRQFYFSFRDVSLTTKKTKQKQTDSRTN